MRRLLLVPTVLMSVACVRTWTTPATGLATYGEDRATVRPVPLPSSQDVLAKWQLAAENPWNAWAKYTLFASLDEFGTYAELPDVEQLEVVQRARFAARAAAAAGVPESTAIVVDLRGAASVAFGAELARRSKTPVSLVPTFNNWPYENGIVPADETLAALVSEDPGASAGKGPPVFMLDAFRLAFRDQEIADGLVDNRYLLSRADFPSAAVLRANGITRVIYVVESLDDSDVEEDDLHYAFIELQQSGLALSMVDLEYLSVEAQLYDVFLDRPLVVVERPVIVDDPGFYAKSQGGFGGSHGLPFAAHTGLGHGGAIHFGAGSS